ncbi:hypothetical protein FZO89_06340 [Luteimonas viscosa]|uniref:Uncharacterized protein n=1 Tax=Luteimonas viscosa TaxID=1132694 RepID=A0A5D4XQ48_9GAMM|nr:hypothetical protein [Luteimonas viscosa]TYT25901.1 hypothetical protein FZO89_06340 [Luteimonas viscosa]
MADLLSGAMRQNPSHPLFRELSQVPAEEFRQWVMDFLTMPPGGARDLPAHAAAPLAQATAAAAALLRENAAQQSAPAQSLAEARAEADALRATVQAQAQQTAAERTQATPGTPRAGEDGRQMAAALVAANGAQEGRVATDARYAGLMQALAQPARAESAVPATQNPAGAPTAMASQTAPAVPAQATAPPDSARTLQDPAVPLMQGRTPVEAPLPARAERVAGSAEPMPAGGLPGLVGAAGVTLAAVGQPAGTTFAQAPQQAVRARKSEETRDKRDKHAREAQQRDSDGDSQSQSRRHADGHGDAARKRSPKAAAAAASGGDGRRASPATTAAAGHTATAPGLPPAAYTQDADIEPEEQARPAGHTAAGESSDAMSAQSRRQQWLYWSLIAVTYSCLAVALGMMTPLAASLPIATESLPLWRNALTTTGLATGLWAWLLARRLR